MYIHTYLYRTVCMYLCVFMCIPSAYAPHLSGITNAYTSHIHICTSHYLRWAMYCKVGTYKVMVHTYCLAYKCTFVLSCTIHSTTYVPVQLDYGTYIRTVNAVVDVDYAMNTCTTVRRWYIMQFKLLFTATCLCWLLPPTLVDCRSDHCCQLSWHSPEAAQRAALLC